MESQKSQANSELSIKFSNAVPPAVERRYELSERWLTLGLGFSIILHLLVFSYVGTARVSSNQVAEVSDEPITLQFQTKPRNLPVVDTFQETAKEEPKEARFASERNLSTDEETSPDRSISNIPQMGGGENARPQVQTQTRQSATPSKRILTLSQADILQDEKQIKETLKRAGPKGVMSEGFMERVKRGSEMKLNARYFDYGNYINRMRVKLSQRWGPHKTIVPQMYQQRMVRVDVVVVLNEAGEVVELNTIAPSRFNKYDEEAIRALRESSPFPNPPKSLIQDDKLVYLTWSFVLTMDSWGSGVGAVE